MSEIIVHTIIFLVAFVLYRYTQQLIERNNKSIENVSVNDRLLNCKLVTKINEYLSNNKTILKILFIMTSLMIDVGALIVLMKYIVWGEYKTPVILLFGMLLRQINQLITKLPAPDKLLWFYPGVPSICVTYDVSTDFFFSGHTFFALTVGLDFYNSEYFIVKLYSLFFVFLEIIFVIVTKSHYWMDVYAAIATYFALRFLTDFYLKI